MNDIQIRRHRTQSILKQLVPEALCSLSDTQLAGLCVTEVICFKGRYDADVYLDKMMYDEKEQAEILSKLQKVASHLQGYCARAEGWYRAPKLHFKFDDQLEKQNKMEDLFKQIKKELDKTNG